MARLQQGFLRRSMFVVAPQQNAVIIICMSGKVITIAQQKGGAGKTTLAVHLAVSALLDGKSVALIDSDPQGSLGRWFMTRLEARGGDPGGLELSTASAWGIGYECGKLKKQNDLVIVDTPPKIDADLRPALRESDLVVVPVSASQIDLWATDSVIDLADRERVPVLAVLNRVRKGTRLTQQMQTEIEGLDCTVAATQLSNRVIYAETIGRGLSAVETQKSGPAAEEIKALAAEIEAHLTAE